MYINTFVLVGMAFFAIWGILCTIGLIVMELQFRKNLKKQKLLIHNESQLRSLQFDELDDGVYDFEDEFDYDPAFDETLP